MWLLLLIPVVLWVLFTFIGIIGLWCSGDYFADAVIEAAQAAFIAVAVITLGVGVIGCIAWLIHLSGVVSGS